MSYTITISGAQQPGDGQSAEQLDQDIAQKARTFVASLQGVSAAFIQTVSGGMENLTEKSEPATPEPMESAQEAQSG